MKSRYALCCMVLFAALAFEPASPRDADVTFEQRLKAQRIIEKLYYSHQIGATRPFDEAVPQELLREKVRRSLKLTVALERLWNTPITAEMLRGESQRIALKTRMPGRLSELYTALGKDPALFQETLVRASLAERLARGFFSQDQRIHGAARHQAEALRRGLLSGTLDLEAEAGNRRIEVVARPDRSAGGALPDQSTFSPEEFDSWRSLAPALVREIGPLREEEGAFTIRVILAEDDRSTKVAIYSLPKLSWDEWWNGVSVDLDERTVRAVARGGRAPIPVGGPDTQWRPEEFLAAISTSDSATASSTGLAGSCDTADSWTRGSLATPTPDPRAHVTAVWTGSVMLIWGGNFYTNPGVQEGTGSRYDPATDLWTPISNLGAPAPRTGHTAIWTGSEMVVWGGKGYGPASGCSGVVAFNSCEFIDGARYDPASDRWTKISA
ncbi:MAG TPA: kelch repeat-containing protein, partial [Candidatus Polarisedimenticolia bacterium]